MKPISPIHIGVDYDDGGNPRGKIRVKIPLVGTSQTKGKIQEEIDSIFARARRTFALLHPPPGPEVPPQFLADLADALLPGQGPSASRIGNVTKKPDRQNYATVLPSLREHWSRVPWPDTYEEAMKSVADYRANGK